MRQFGSQLGQPALPINGLATRAVRDFLPNNIPHLAVLGYLMLPNTCVVEYSDDVLVLFPPPHFLYQLPARLLDNSVIIVAVVNVWIDLFMRQVKLT